MSEITPDTEENGGGGDARTAAAESLLANLPELHFWGGRARVGGLDRRIGNRLIDEVRRYERPRIIETGAGASSLLFCTLEPEALTTIAPDAKLRDRMLEAAREREISTEPLRFICERSETALPALALDGERYDVAFVDGCHNWPGVFVDFCYMNMMLSAGGTLLVDDTHLYSVVQLVHLLRQEKDYEYVALDGKLATFRKVTDDSFLPEWGSQPYIAQSTLTAPR